jgi:acetyl-CoA acetyltransferase
MTWRLDDDWGGLLEPDEPTASAAVVGIGESDHSARSERDVTTIVAQAVERALADAGLRPSDVDGILCSASPDQFDARAFHRHFGTHHDIWESRTGGTTPTAFHEASLALQHGRASCVLNSYGVAWATKRAEMVGGPGDAHAHEAFKQNLEVPFGWFPQPVYFATVARRHMHEYGTTEDDLGAVAVATRRHATRSPNAVLHDRPLSIEQYRASPQIAAPFRREDCCLVSDGGGAYILTRPDRARDAPHPLVELAGVANAGWSTGWHFAQQRAFTATPQVYAAPAAFAAAGITPTDVDVYACYDAFTILTLMQIEDSGFCEKGDGGWFVSEAGIDADSGRLPTNTHGGLLSHAYINGIAHITEIVRQLRHQADAQVRGAEIAAYGGFTGGTAATLVLRRGR